MGSEMCIRDSVDCPRSVSVYLGSGLVGHDLSASVDGHLNIEMTNHAF